MYERTVYVKGDVRTIWQHLLNTLTAHRYEIESQSPHTLISAKRGSKLSSFLLEGTTGGYRELNIALSPQQAGEFEIKFRFEFPAWAMTLPGTKKDCSRMVDEFVQITAGASETVAPQGTVCEKCGTENPVDASFCRECGAKLQLRTLEKKTAPEPLVCPKCKASLPAGAKFCSACGARL